MINILIAGDFCPHNRVGKLIDEQNYAAVFKDILPYTKASDINIVNFETTIANECCKPIIKRGPNLKCTENAIKALKYAGFDCVTLANNHFRDYGDEGCRMSFEALRRNDICYVGAGNCLEEAKKVLYKHIKGKTIAICNFCEHEFTIADDNQAGCNPIDPITNYYAIAEARNNADYVIVVTHGGHENFQYPSIRMKKLFHFYVDCGADAVINHHQHCYSGYEFYNEKPIFYGLGNFSFDWRNNKQWTTGFFVILSIDDNTSIIPQIIPYRQGTDTVGIEVLSGEAKELVMDDINRINLVINDESELKRKCEEYFDSTDYPYLYALEPVYNKYIRALYDRGFYPTALSQKRLVDLQLYLQCESHFERVMRILKRLF